MNIAKIKVTIAVALAMGTAQAVAGGGGASPCPGCATEVTQVANNVELGYLYKKQIDAEIRDLERMAQWSKDIARDRSLTQKQLDASGTVGAIGGIINSGFSIATTLGQVNNSATGTLKTTMDSSFQQLYGGRFGSSGKSTKSFGDAYSQWATATNEALRAVAVANGATIDGLQTGGIYQVRTQDLYNKMVAAKGHQGALDAMAQMALTQVSQLDELKMLIANNEMAANRYMATQNARQDAQDTGQKFWTNFKSIGKPADFPKPPAGYTGLKLPAAPGR